MFYSIEMKGFGMRKEEEERSRMRDGADRLYVCVCVCETDGRASDMRGRVEVNGESNRIFSTIREQVSKLYLLCK